LASIFKRKTVFLIIAILIIGIVVYYILPVSIPIISALITALFLEPAVKFFQRKIKLKRKYAVLIVFLVFLLFIGLTSYFVTTKVVGEAVKVVKDAPTYINEISVAWANAETYLTHAAKDLPKDFVDEITSQINDFFKRSKEIILNYVNIETISAALSYIPNYLVSFLVFLIALFLFMIDLPQLRKMIYNHLTEETADKVSFMTSRLSYVIFGFFKAQFLVSIIIFIASLIGLLIITPDIAFVMSLIIWLIDFIPIIGSIVILGPWALFHLVTGDIALGTKLAILAAILLIIRRTVEPKVMGSHIGLSPLATLIAMYIGLKLLGMLGFILGPLVLIVFNSAKEAGIIKTDFKI
jgi:sporulation integral membrane protein YtvI